MLTFIANLCTLWYNLTATNAAVLISAEDDLHSILDAVRYTVGAAVAVAHLILRIHLLLARRVQEIMLSHNNIRSMRIYPSLRLRVRHNAGMYRCSAFFVVCGS